MKCPACGAENIRDVQQCASCGRILHPSQDPPATVDIRISRIAIASSICTLIGALSFVPLLIAALTGFVALLATGVAFLLGIAGLREIATSGDEAVSCGT